MLSDSQKQTILARAYIPEHSVDLIRILAGGDPCYLDGFFFCSKPHHIILIAYPIGKAFTTKDLEDVMARLAQQYDPQRISLIAPELPPSFNCQEVESDWYYVLDLSSFNPSSRAARLAERARGRVELELSRTFTTEHDALSQEFLERVSPPSKITALYKRIHLVIEGSADAFLLNAWNKKGNLVAWLVVDLAPRHFSVYVIGCHSKKHYEKWAADLLFRRMIELSIQRGKTNIHLGLGVNEGIKQFKKKWGGRPFFPYHSCELQLRGPSFLESVQSYLGGFM